MGAPSHRIRCYDVSFVQLVVVFFRFLGHLACCAKEVITRKKSISWLNLLNVIFRSGVRLVIPVVVISSLLGVSLVLNIYSSLSPYNLENKAFIIAQNIFFYDGLPFIINIVLSIQIALDLVSERRTKLQTTAQQTLVVDIIPLLIGINICSLSLYIYSTISVFFSTFLCFRYFLKADTHEYLLQLSTTITSYSILFSILKTFLFCTFVSVIAGFYYYQVAEGYLSIRKAVSRIMTRSFAALVVGTVYFKFLDY